MNRFKKFGASQLELVKHPEVHHFDPGIHPYPGGLFWTVPLPTNLLSTSQFRRGEHECERLGTAGLFQHSECVVSLPVTRVSGRKLQL
jgi:hypothetical protein